MCRAEQMAYHFAVCLVATARIRCAQAADIEGGKETPSCFRRRARKEVHVIQEALWTRACASMFDVSKLGGGLSNDAGGGRGASRIRCSALGEIDRWGRQGQ